MICEKHKLRKRPETCFYCANETQAKVIYSTAVTASCDLKRVIHSPAVAGSISPKISKAAVKKVKESLITNKEELVDFMKEAINDTSTNKEQLTKIKSQKFDEREYIQAIVEKELRNTVIKLRSELAEIKKIEWEHLEVPLPVFSMQLMYGLEKEGWKYVQMIRDGKKSGYTTDGDYVIIQRVKTNEYPPKPDFEKRGTIKKYLGDKNEHCA
jgi:hypothetical protein